MANKYYFRKTTDFGDETMYWRDVTAKVTTRGSSSPDINVEYITLFPDGSSIWNKCIKRFGSPVYKRELMPVGWFDQYIKPFVVDKEEKMNPKNYEPKKQPEFLQDNFLQKEGMTFEQLSKYIHDTVYKETIEAIARHDRTKIEISDYVFEIGQRVLKHTGDYQAEGTVIGRFKMLNGSVRYAVEHTVVGGGSFIHLYSEKNLKLLEQNGQKSSTEIVSG